MDTPTDLRAPVAPQPSLLDGTLNDFISIGNTDVATGYSYIEATSAASGDLYAWVGASGGSWNTASNWHDTTTNQTPAATAPGATIPVTITGPTGSVYEVIGGGGTAASVAISGLIDLAGTYNTGALNVGSVQFGASSATESNGTLALGSGSAIQASTVTVADGALSLAGGGVSVTASGAVTLGTPATYTGTYYSPSESSTLSVAGGAALTTSGSLVVAYGTAMASGAGSDVSVAGSLVLGTPAPASYAGAYTNAAYGSLIITGGATVAVGGNIVDNYAPDVGIAVSGSGSRLTAHGTLTESSTEFYQNVSAGSGGAIQVAGLSLTGAIFYSAFTVDATSSIEIGTAGSAAAGALTVDAGVTVTEASAAPVDVYANLIDNGDISLTGSLLSIAGTLSGGGIVQVGTDASLTIGGMAGSVDVLLGGSAAMTLDGAAAAGGTIAFAGADAALTIGTSYSNSSGSYVYTPYAVGATLSGFAVGDAVNVSNTALTSAVYSYSGNSVGNLALYAGTVAVENLTIAGNYSGQTFSIAQASSSGSAIVLVSGGSGGAGPVSTTTDSYNWIGTSGGSWGGTANWQDVTKSQAPAAAVPGAHDPVTIAGPTGSVYEVIGGGGTAGSVAISGLIDLAGTYNTGALNVGSVQLGASSATESNGTLALGSGSAIQASTVTVADGALSLAGGGVSLTASGAVTLGTPATYTGTYYSPSESSTLSVASGAALTTSGSLVVAYGTAMASGAGSDVSVAGSLVLGTPAPASYAGAYTDAATGSLIIASGATAAVGGNIVGNYSSDVGIDVSGSGSRLTAHGTLTLNSTEFYQNVSASSGGAIQVAGLSLTGSIFYTAFTVDASSSIEIGTAGSAAAGALTVDAGVTVTAASAGRVDVYANLIDNGDINQTGSLLSIGGTLSGGGIVQVGTDASLTTYGMAGSVDVQIGANAAMTLDGTAALGGTIAFAGAGAALTIGASYSNSSGSYVYTPYAVGATLSGFAIGDAVNVSNTALTSAVYSFSGNSVGNLALYAGTVAVENLTIAGNYTGQTFSIAQASSSGSAIVLLSGGSGGSGTVSTTTDSYNWIGTSGGSWGSTANWQDVTKSQSPAAAVPGLHDPVTITGPTGSVYEVIGGGGTAALVAISGLIDLAGTYNIGALNVGSVQPGASSATESNGTLALGSGSAMQASTVTVADGALSLAGGGVSVTASGAVTLGTPATYTGTYYSPSEMGTLNVAGGAALTTSGSLVVAYGTVTASGGGSDVSVAGSLVLGTPAPASYAGAYTDFADGSLIITSGATVAVIGSIVDNDASDIGIAVSGGGSRLSARGSLTLDSSIYYQNVRASSGGAIQVAGLSLTGSSFNTAFTVDASSSIEIGTAGSAAAGALTVDAGVTVTEVSAAPVDVYANLIDNGDINQTGSLLSIGGTLSGSGIVQAGPDASLAIGGMAGSVDVLLGGSAAMTLDGTAAAGGTIVFAGTGATLTIGAAESYNNATKSYTYTPYAAGATLSGFAIGDTIDVSNTALTNAVYSYSGDSIGTLALYAGTVAVENLTIAGNYTGESFQIGTTSSGGSDVSVLAQLGCAAPASEAVLAGTSALFAGLSISDPNAEATSVTVTLSDTVGQLSANSTGGASVTGSGTTLLRISGALSQVNAALATVSYLATKTGTDTIAVNAADSLGSTALQTIVAVTVLPIAPPSITLPTATLIVHQNVAGTISPLSIVYADGVVPGEQVTATVSDSLGTLAASIATTGGGGTVTGSGTKSLSIVGTLPQVNADLTTLTYETAASGSDTISVTASGSHGGAAIPADITVDVGNYATAALVALSGSGSLQQSSTTYTLNLGQIAESSTPETERIGLENAAEPLADLLQGSFSAATGASEIVFSANSFAALGVGGTIDLINATLNSSQTGTFESQITLYPADYNNSGYDEALTPQTIVAVGTVIALALAEVNTPSPINFGDLHFGAASGEAISITNGGAPLGESLNVTATAAGDATVSGAISLLAGGNTDSSSITAELETGTAGIETGVISLAFTSEAAAGGVQSGAGAQSLASAGSGTDGLDPIALQSQTIAATGTIFNDATASAVAPNSVNFGDAHVGVTLSRALAISNTATADGFSENLDAVFGPTSGAVNASGTINGLAAGANNNTSLAIGFGTAQDGIRSGTAVLDLTSDGNGVDTLGTTALATQTIAATGTLFNYATASLVAPNPINFGEAHVGASLSRALSITNTATADGFSESLDASFTTIRGAVNASGTISALAAAHSDNTHLDINLGTAQDGIQSGTAVVAFTSDSSGIDTLGTTILTVQTITAAGTLFNYATASTATPAVMNFGEAHVGSALSHTLSISNLATADGFSENLDAMFAASTGAVSGSGAISKLAAGSIDTTDLHINLGTAQDGVQSGNAVLTLISDGSGIDTLGTTALTAQTITATGTLFNLATASAVSGLINFGQAHVAAALNRELSISNIARADGFSESLDAAFNTSIGAINASGTVSKLVAGGIDSTHLNIGLNTAYGGVQSGSVVLALASDGSSIDTLGTTALSSQTIVASGTLFNYATASTAAPNPINFGEAHVGAQLSRTLSISNIATVGGFSENLDAAFQATTGAVSAGGAVTALAPGNSDATHLTINVGTAGDGVRSGTAVLALTSDGGGVDTLGTTPLAAQTITALGTLFNYATANTVAPKPVDFGEAHVGSSLSHLLSISNMATADGFSENLDAGFAETTGAVSGSGTISELAADDSANLSINLGTAQDGVRAGTALLSLTSDGNGVDTLGTTALTAQTIMAVGTLFNYATASSVTNSFNFGQAHVGAVLSHTLTISNTATADGFSENLDAAFSGSTGAASGTGSVNELAAGGNDGTHLNINLGTAQDGIRSGTAVLTLASDGSGVDTLGTTALAPQTISATGTLFNLANAAIPTAVNFGIVHVGAGSSDLITQALTVANAAAADGFSENLDASVGGATAGLTASGYFAALAAGGTNTTSLLIGLETGMAGIESGSATVALQSDGTEIDILGTTSLGSRVIAVTGTVNNYATASFERIAGVGILTQNGTTYTLNLGTVEVGATSVTADLGVLNAAAGPADLLAGTMTVVGSSAFINSGFAAFSGLSAGQVDTSLAISLSAAKVGVFQETVTLDATGSNSSGYSGTLTPDVLTVVGAVVPQQTQIGPDIWQVGSNYVIGTSLADEVLLQYQNNPVVVGEFGSNVVPIAAATLPGGYEVAWKASSASGNEYVVWDTDASGNYTSSPTGVVPGTSLALEDLEPGFNYDLNGDGTIGPAGTSLGPDIWQVGSNYVIGASLASGVLLEYQNSPVTIGQFGTNVVAYVAARLSGGGYEVAWKVIGANEYVVWNTDSNGNYTSSPTGVVPGTNLMLEELEPGFNYDLNGDGTIGPAGTLLGPDIWQIGSNYVIGASLASGVLLEYQNSPVTIGQFGTNVVAYAAAQLPGGGYEVAWKVIGADEYVVWDTNTSGDYVSSPTGVVSGTNLELEELEPSFNYDLNGDGTIGPVGASLDPNIWQVGSNYVIGASLASGVALQYQNSQVTVGQFGTNVVPYAAAALSNGGYEVAWKVTGADEYVVWNTNASGDYASSPTGVVPGNSPVLEELERSFNYDLNGDGTIGLKPTSIIQIDNTTTLASVGNAYVLEDTGGTGPILQYQNSPVTVGQFGSNVVPIGAVQTATGYDVAWTVMGADEYVVWSTDINGNYTGSPTGVVPGESFALEDLEPTFGQDLNGDGRLSTALVTTVGAGDVLNLSNQAQVTTINLGSNGASATPGLNGAHLTFIGSPDAITLGSGEDTIEYALTPSSGIETIAGFVYGTDELNIDLMGAASSTLQAYDTSANGLAAIAITSSANPACGVVLLNMTAGQTAATLLGNHTSFSGGHALIS
ncbi:MAG TPA: choice-of-anchor D domain-containing protein [Acetobacteraceae bacterium]|nr:choice-of-anchor D domain-containing protein [Acetobacteraceae bacterium]